MLVTTRYPGESVIITVPPGDKPQRITVKPIQVRGDRVRLGFDAPWRDHFDEMAKKTCIRKLCKYLPMSDTVMNAVAIDEAAESGGESYDASFLFAETVPELASGESESKVDQLRERVSTVTKPKEVITESGEVVIPPTREVTHDMLASLLVEIEKRGGLATFYEQQRIDDMDIANMSKPNRSKLCTAANVFLKQLIDNAGE